MQVAILRQAATVGEPAVTATLTGVAAAPGFGPNRAGVILIESGVPLLGGIVLATAIVLPVAATSSTGAVKLATRLAASTKS
jgi:hypothetical protein